jgi:DNA-binding transcriptional LysR family regulator
MCADRRVDLVEEGYDVAIRAGQLGDSTLIARRVGSIRSLLVAAPGYLEQRGTPASPAALEAHDCIAFGDAQGVRWTLQRGSRSVEVSVRARLVVNDFDMLREAAGVGLGITSMPDYLCIEDLRAGRLRPVLEDWRPPAIPVHAVYPSVRHLSAKMTAFLDLVRDRLRLSSDEPQS